MKIKNLSWIEAIRMCYLLAEKIVNSGLVFDTIIAISRGGLVPARIISDVLGIDELYTLRSRLWGIGGMIYKEPVVQVYERMNLSGRKVLVVDEVVDTGATMVRVREIIERYDPAMIKTAVIHCKPTAKYTPDYYVEKLSEWVWILYPWSLFESLYGLAVKRGSNNILGAAHEIMIKNNIRLTAVQERLLEKSINMYTMHRIHKR